jgi:hypothetical protein
MAASVVTVLTLHYVVLSTSGVEPVERMAGNLIVHHNRGDKSGTHRVLVRNLVFYSHLKQQDLPERQDFVSFLASPSRVYCVVTGSDLDKFRAEGVKATTIEEVMYFNPAMLRVRTLIDPNPARDVERIVLVTNK